MSSKRLADTLLSIFAGEEVVAVWGGMSGLAPDGVRLQLPAVLAHLLSDSKMVMDFLELPLLGCFRLLGHHSLFGAPKDSASYTV